MRRVLVVFGAIALVALPAWSASAHSTGSDPNHPSPGCILTVVNADVGATGKLTFRGSALGAQLNADAFFSTNPSKTIELIICLTADVGVTVQVGAAAVAQVSNGCTSVDVPVTVRGGLTGGGVQATVSAKLDGKTILLAKVRTTVGAGATLSTSIDADACVEAHASVGVGV